MCAEAGEDQSTERLKLHRDALCAHVYWDGGFTEVPLAAETSLVFGRGNDCDVVVDDPSVSRAHARLETGPPLSITDLGSANGTHVDGIPMIPDQPRPLRFGMLVELGDAVMVVRAPVGLKSTTPPALRVDRSIPSQHELLGLAERLGRSHIAVNIVGEAGSGKRRFADALHTNSPNSEHPFVRLGCADWSEKAIERELFGCVAGFVRSGDAAYEGAFQRAGNGTLYLDKVTDLAPRIQDRLARCLELREFQPLGSSQSIGIDARVIASSNERLETAVSRGTMRPALYLRIVGVIVEVPALRERSAELPSLVQEALETAASELKQPVPELQPDVLTLFAGYDFPGNFRELIQMLRTVLLASDKATLAVKDLPRKLRSTLSNKRRRRAPLRAELDEVLRARIIQALEDCGGNQTKAAKMLGMPRRTLVARLDAFGIPRPRKGKRNK